MRNQLITSFYQLISESLKLVGDRGESSLDRRFRDEIVTLQQERHGVIIILASILRGIGYFANLQYHILNKYSIEIGEEYGSNPRHPIFVGG
jgi:hypothetical protein